MINKTVVFNFAWSAKEFQKNTSLSPPAVNANFNQWQILNTSTISGDQPLGTADLLWPPSSQLTQGLVFRWQNPIQFAFKKARVKEITLSPACAMNYYLGILIIDHNLTGSETWNPLGITNYNLQIDYPGWGNTSLVDVFNDILGIINRYCRFTSNPFAATTDVYNRLVFQNFGQVPGLSLSIGSVTNRYNAWPVATGFGTLIEGTPGVQVNGNNGTTGAPVYAPLPVCFPLNSEIRLNSFVVGSDASERQHVRNLNSKGDTYIYNVHQGSTQTVPTSIQSFRDRADRFGIPWIHHKNHSGDFFMNTFNRSFCCVNYIDFWFSWGPNDYPLYSYLGLNNGFQMNYTTPSGVTNNNITGYPQSYNEYISTLAQQSPQIVLEFEGCECPLDRSMMQINL
jgi:hypothetical protein